MDIALETVEMDMTSFCYAGSLPLELWVVVLRVLVTSMDLSEFLQLCSVSTLWRRLVYESVTVIGETDSACMSNEVLGRFVSLQDLALSDFLYEHCATPISDVGLRAATSLTNLNIASTTTISNDGISELVNLTSLSPSPSITDSGMQNLTNVIELTLPLYNSISGDAIAKMTKLTRLYSWSSDITSFALKALTNLTTLSFHGTFLLENFDDALKRLTNLTWLDYGNFAPERCIVSNDGISGLVNLTYLDNSNDRFLTDSALQNLTKLQSLILSQSQCGVGDYGISNLVNLTALFLNESVTDAGIVNLTNLTWLDIERASGVTDNGICHLSELTSLIANRNITENGISKLSKLEFLSIQNQLGSNGAGLFRLLPTLATLSHNGAYVRRADLTVF